MLFKNSHNQYKKVPKRQPAETTFLVPQLSLKKASTTVSQGAALEQRTKLPMLAWTQTSHCLILPTFNRLY